MSLRVYRRKRKFHKTPEPPPRVPKVTGKGLLRFVIQKHAASRTHYDFRLELDGALKSWAVPKGPTLTSGDPRLAVRVEDHPIEYGKFEGVIPKGNYGAGTVLLWDAGTYVERGSQGRADSERALQKGLERGHITFILNGSKLRGEFALVKVKKKGAEENAWLLIKKHDAEASRVDILKEERSVATGRTLKEIAAEAEKKGEVWLPKKGKVAKLKVLPPPTPKKTAPAHLHSMPRGVRPMEAVFTPAPPEGSDWIFELYPKGIRTIAEIDASGVRMHSRALLPLDRKYTAIVSGLRTLKRSAVLDGEIVLRKKVPVFSVHDVLFLDGKDLRERPLTARKAALDTLIPPKGVEVREWHTDLSALVRPDADTVVIAKRKDSPYRTGLARDWLKFHPKNVTAKRAEPSDRPPVTHPDKIFWPKEGYTKGDLIEYYECVAPYLLPHLKDRPQSMHRQPDGIRDFGFFHKDVTSFIPRRIQTERVYSESAKRTLNYLLCQDLWSLLYIVNLGCIELNPWLSRKGNLEHPDWVVIDLDPDENDFREVVKTALEVKRVLDKVGAKSWCKTSGGTGLHICIPTGGKYDYETGRAFAEAVCRRVHAKLEDLTSMERTPARRRGKIYLDCLQNRRGQTLAAPYCVRPYPKAPVSTPLKWTEVNAKLRPDAFTIKNTLKRLKRLGDLWKPVLETAVDLEACLKKLSKLPHI